MEQLDLTFEEPATDEEIAERALKLYKSGQCSNIPYAIVAVLTNERLNIDPLDERFKKIKTMVENKVAKGEGGNKVIAFPRRKPKRDVDDLLFNSGKMNSAGPDQF